MVNAYCRLTASVTLNRLLTSQSLFIAHWVCHVFSSVTRHSGEFFVIARLLWACQCPDRLF